MKGLLVLLVAAVCAAVLAGGAGADRPIREFMPQTDDVISGACPFDVGLTILRNEAHLTTFSDGRQLVTGSLKVRLTNLTPGSGKSIDLNASGPGLLTETATAFEIKAEGRWFWFFLPGELGPGSPGMAVATSGLAYLRGDANGLTFTPSKNTTDICAALA